MDSKELKLIRKHYHRIATGQFSEGDVFSLLILLRPLTTKNSPVYEFANFIAHREKDRGYIRDYVDQIKRKLDNLGKQNEVIKIKPVFSKEEIGKSLNQILQDIGFLPFDESQVDKIVICIISLLQNVRILDKTGVKIGQLILASTENEIQLLGKVHVQNKVDCVFPVLIAPNRYIPGPKNQTPELTPLVEVFGVDGELKIMSTEKLIKEVVDGELYEYYPVGKYLVSAPGVCRGRPTFKYTRLEAAVILDLLAAGWTVDQLIYEYSQSHLTREAIVEAVGLAKQAFIRSVAVA